MDFNGVNFDTYFNNYPDKNGYFGKYGGAYIADELKEAMKEIDRLEKTPAEQEIHINWAEYYPLLSLLSLLSLAMGFLLENSFCRRLV